MPELRQNRFTKEWVIIATERAKRPKDMVVLRAPRNLPSFDPRCPFCPGNEKSTPPEVLRVAAPGNGSWLVRVVPNKFAALQPELTPRRVVERSHRTVNGFGVHEVVIETPDHSQATALMSDAQVASVFRALKARCSDLSLDSRIANVTIFKNHGMDAGTSLEHPHSQLIATPVIPPRYAAAYMRRCDTTTNLASAFSAPPLTRNCRTRAVWSWSPTISSLSSRLLPTLPFAPISIPGGIWPTSPILAVKKSPTWRTCSAWCWLSFTMACTTPTSTSPFVPLRRSARE